MKNGVHFSGCCALVRGVLLRRVEFSFVREKDRSRVKKKEESN